MTSWGMNVHQQMRVINLYVSFVTKKLFAFEIILLYLHCQNLSHTIGTDKDKPLVINLRCAKEISVN